MNGLWIISCEPMICFYLAFKSPDSLKLSQLIRPKNTYPSKQLADSLAPNSTLFPAFPLTMGRIWGWLKLTILFSILCLLLSSNHCCWRATSVRTSKVLYCFLFRPSKVAPESINFSIWARFLLMYWSCFLIACLFLFLLGRRCFATAK